MTPIQAIEGIDKLRGELNQRMSRLGWEMEDITEQWQGLKMVGGAREDHAAQLLCCLRAHLDGLAEFTAQVSAQITAMKADPYKAVA